MWLLSAVVNVLLLAAGVLDWRRSRNETAADDWTDRRAFLAVMGGMLLAALGLLGVLVWLVVSLAG